ncbi:Ig-like domain-containing protein [Desulfonema magnum]|nr:Ig-like domain-containing protein [Desulfonema magnum]
MLESLFTKGLTCFSDFARIWLLLILLAVLPGAADSDVVYAGNTGEDCLFDLDNTSVDENHPAGTAVGIFSYMGIAMPTYSLSPDAENTDNGAFTIDGNMLGTAETFDFESRSKYTIQVLADGCEKEFAITVTDVNESPEITQGESVTVEMDEDSSPTGFDLTLNASDPDENDVLTWTIAADAENGTAEVSGTGDSQEVIYIPDSGYNGTDSFVVQISDGELTDLITVNVIIGAQNDPPEIAQGDSVTVTMDENSSPTALSLSLNASDPDDDILTWSIGTDAENGAATASGTGDSQEISYVPDSGYNGTDSFVVQVSDGELTDSVTVNVIIGNGQVIITNAPPEIAEGNAVTVTMDEDGYPTRFSLTLNAADPDQDFLTWNISSVPLNGVAEASGTGNSQAVSYTPKAGYNGTDNFVVQVSDGELTDSITVNVSIQAQNDLPVIAEGDAVTVTMDEDGFPTAFALTLNAADPDGDTLTWSVIAPAENGMADVGGTGYANAVSYVPDPGFSGTDRFTVQVSDGELSDSVIVNVSIGAQNDPPEIAEGDAVTVTMDEDGFPDAFALTLNAADPDGDTLTWSVIAPAENGMADVGGTGYANAVSYVPDPGFSGSDRFTVQVSDGELSDSVIVNVSISAQNDPPEIAEGDAVTVTMDEDGFPTAFALTLNAADPDGDTLAWSVIAPAENGMADVGGTGYANAVSYVPDPGFSGTDRFTVQVSDGELSDSVIVNVSISAQNDPPEIAEGDAVTVTMDEDGFPDAFALTLNAADPDGDTLTWSVIAPAENGMADVGGTGYANAVSYVPDPGFSGSDRFTVQVSDGELSDSVIVNVSIGAQNDPPEIAEGDAVTVTMDEDGFPDAFALTLNAADPDGDTLAWSVIAPAENGMADVGGTGYANAVSYVPDPGFSGSDRFTVQVSDGELTDTIVVNVNVRIKFEGECATLCEESGEACVTVFMDEDASPTPFDLTLNASDSDNDILTWSISTPAGNGTAHADGTGYTKDISYAPDSNFNGTDRFEIQVSDGWLTDSVVVYVCIAPRDDPPVIVQGNAVTISMDENGFPTDFDLTLNASDPDGDVLTWRVVSPADHGTAHAEGEGNSQSVSYIPAPGYIGTDSFVVQVSDGESNDSITVNVEINATVEGDCDILCEQEENACAAVYMDEDSFPTAFDLSLKASDPDGDILTWTISSPASNGTAHVSGTGYAKDISYIPDADYNGTDRFEIQVSDGWLTDSVIIYVCIRPHDENSDNGSNKASDDDSNENSDDDSDRASDDDSNENSDDDSDKASDDDSNENSDDDSDRASDDDSDKAPDNDSEIPLSADSTAFITEEDKNTTDVIFGDIDNNETVDVRDAVLGLQILAGITPTHPVFITADVNGDGRIGTEEVIHILQFISDLQ